MIVAVVQVGPVRMAVVHRRVNVGVGVPFSGLRAGMCMQMMRVIVPVLVIVGKRIVRMFVPVLFEEEQAQRPRQQPPRQRLQHTQSLPQPQHGE